MADYGKPTADLGVLSVTAEMLRKKAAMFQRADRADIAELYARKAEKIDAVILKMRQDREHAA